MIETVLIFALGFLVASLCALLLVPVLNKRATRLARQRIDGLFPMSMKEITAERDALRAEFAVAQCRLERQVAQARSLRHADMAALGTRTMEAADLSRTIEKRETTIAERKEEITRNEARIASLDGDLAHLRSEHTTGLAVLNALEGAHQQLISDLRSARRERESVRRELFDALSTSEGSAAHVRSKSPSASEPEPTDLERLRAERERLIEDLDYTRSELRSAEEALSRALADREPATAAGDQELRQRISEVAAALMLQERDPETAPLARTGTGRP